jgi:RNA polymerase sigma factor (sigma-70 family)
MSTGGDAGDPERSDAELLAAWRAGERTAGEQLFARHVHRVLRFFRTKAAAQSEDLVQRTFLACVRSRDAVREGTSFRSYLFSIARNELFRHLGRSVAREFDPLTVSVAELRTSPSDALLRAERNAGLLAALCRLPLELQIAVELHYWEGLSIGELADVLGIPGGTVKTRLFRARALMRDTLADAKTPGADNDFEDLDAWARALRDDVLDDASRLARRVPD